MSEENKKLCSKENPCENCQEEQKKQLAKIEDWEINRKEKLEKFEFIEAEFCPNKTPDNPNKVQYSSFCHGKEYKNETCLSCQAVVKIIKFNSYGDKTEELKEHDCQAQIDGQVNKSTSQQ